MYKKGLLNELSQKLIKKVAKRTVAKYQKESDAASARALKAGRTQDAPSANVTDAAADKALEKTEEKRAQARRVLSKMQGTHVKGDVYKGSKDLSLTTSSKHGLSRQDMRGDGAKTVYGARMMGKGPLVPKR